MCLKIYRFFLGSYIGCGGNFSARSGVITSQNYPAPYPHNTDCFWLITVAPGHVVELTIEDLEIEHSENNCEFDYLAVSSS